MSNAYPLLIGDIKSPSSSSRGDENILILAKNPCKKLEKVATQD